MKVLLAVVCLCVCAQAQNSVIAEEAPPRTGYEQRMFPDGGGTNIEYVCFARGVNVKSVWARTAGGSNQPNTPTAANPQATLTSIGVAATTGTITFSNAHGLEAGHWITVSGATVDTDLNGTYRIVSVTATQVVITVASVLPATYTEATLTVSTSAPRMVANVWAIQKMFYSGSVTTRILWAGGGSGEDKACESRSTYF